MPLRNLAVSQSTTFPLRGKDHSWNRWAKLWLHKYTIITGFLNSQYQPWVPLAAPPWASPAVSLTEPFQFSLGSGFSNFIRRPYVLSFCSFCGGFSQWKLKHSEHSWKSHGKLLSASGGGQLIGSGHYRMVIIRVIYCQWLPFFAFQQDTLWPLRLLLWHSKNIHTKWKLIQT